MDVIKLLEDSGLLIAAAELNKILPGKVQIIFIMVAQSPDQRKNWKEHSKMSTYVLSSFTLKFIGNSLKISKYLFLYFVPLCSRGQRTACC